MLLRASRLPCLKSWSISPACEERPISLYIADVPDNLIEDLPAASLPPDWRSIYPPASTQQLGSNWLASKSAAGLLVPSVLISGADPTIKNCLLNPEHPGYAHAKFSGPIPLAIDPRF